MESKMFIGSNSLNVLGYLESAIRIKHSVHEKKISTALTSFNSLFKNRFFYILILLFLFKLSFAQIPPNCTSTYTVAPGPWVTMPTLTSGDVVCVDGSGGTFFGTMVVPSGAHLVLCGTGTVFGSITIRNGGTVWRTPGTTFTGSFSFEPGSSERVQNNACDKVNPPSCSAPNAGTISNEHSICFDGNPSTITSSDDGGATSFEWEYSNNGTSGWTPISGANSEAYDPPSGLTAHRWYRRRGGDCSPTQWSGYTNQIKVTVNARPTVTVNDATICEDDAAATFTATSGTATGWLWSNNGSGTAQTTTGTTSGLYTVVVTDGNSCTSLPSSGTLTVNPLPIVISVKGSERCGEGSVLLEAVSNFGKIDWYNLSSGGSLIGSGSQWISGNISTTTTYYAEAISAESCTSSVRLNAVANVNLIPSVNLGSDTILCLGDTIKLGTGLNNVTFFWPKDGSFQDSLDVFSSGNYEVIVTNQNNCVGSDLVNIEFLDIPILELGSDTSICEGEHLKLNAGNGGVKYDWSTGDSVQTIFVDSASKYFVTVSNIANCFSTDSIVVLLDTVPEVNLGKDTSICDLENIILNAGNLGASYSWSNGLSSSEIVVSTKGLYEVMVTNSFLCSSLDAIQIGINPLPKTNLGQDIEVCKYLPIELAVDEINANSYSWSTGELTKSIQTNIPGKYWISVYSSLNCFNSDTIVVFPGADLDVDLINDSVICAGNNSNITVDVQHQTGGLIYDWNTSDDATYISVDSTGTYSVLVKDSKGCWGRDTTNVRVQPLPILELKADTLSICSIEEANESVTITAVHDASYIEWGDGFVGDKYISGISGWFEAFAYDDYTCFDYDSITISEYCRPIHIHLPNIFTPNGDGHNDDFIPFEMVWEDLEYMLVNLKYIDFSVYNRWGELIHSSSLVIPNWGGLNNKGFDSPDGIYFWTLKYKDMDGGEFYDNGYVKLKR